MHKGKNICHNFKICMWAIWDIRFCHFECQKGFFFQGGYNVNKVTKAMHGSSTNWTLTKDQYEQNFAFLLFYFFGKGKRWKWANATSQQSEVIPHFLRDTHQVQKSHPHFPLHHQLLNILPLNFHPLHLYRNLKGFHQDPPGQWGCQFWTQSLEFWQNINEFLKRKIGRKKNEFTFINKT